MDSNIKPIALYLPQYHTIKENDEWWGNGFTEWTNVKKAKPLFKDHHQPHIPLNNNYYDLSTVDEMINQAEMAKKYGIYGFCFYHYWFNGKLLLEKPLHNLLNSDKPDFPFCLSWANENWTRTWDGQDKQVLMKQEYSEEDDRAHIKYLINFFKDPRYIKINDKPVFLMYRSELHPNIKKATEIWREEAKAAGFKDLYLIRMENFLKNINPQLHGFDAGMEFAPDTAYQGKKVAKKNMAKYLFNKLLHKLNIKKSAHFQHGIWSYATLANNMMNKPNFDYKYFKCVCPSWDNSARRKHKAALYIDTSPTLFKKWVKHTVDYTKITLPKEEQLFFINAWNEWGEGCHLEPDVKNGFSILEAFKEGIS